jgi:hypothetical protein
MIAFAQHCHTSASFPGFFDAEESDRRRALLIAYFYQQGDLSLQEAIRDEPTGSSYIDTTYELVSTGGETE